MKLTFVQLAMFVADWKHLKLTDDDLQALEQLIMQRPEAGAVMSGTGGMRKVRFAPPSWNKGKSGATRVCYIHFVDAAACYLITIFAKNEQANLSKADRTAWHDFIVELRKDLGNGDN